MKKSKKQSHNTKVFGWTALAVLSLVIILTIIGLSNTMGEIADKAISHTPDAILASAGVSENDPVSVPVLYYDQISDECVNLYDVSMKDALNARQFEWSSCGYYNKELEQGLVDFELSDEYLPVALGGKLTPNRGIEMSRWFGSVDGKSASYAGTLNMQYSSDGAEFAFSAKNFYPLDEAKFSAGDIVNKDGHNHLFTMNFAVPFTVLASGAEEFTIRADDDTFVYVGDKLVLDMGGIHDALSGRFVIYKTGEIYSGVGDEDLAYSGVNVTAEEGSIVRIFHADRDSADSTFSVKFAGMNLSVTNAELADSNGLQVAYDPSDPSYVAPLGESKVFQPDSTKGLIVIATIEGAVVVVAAVLIASVARSLTKQKAKK